MFSFFLMATHLFFMLGPMHSWAEGNLLLLHGTLMTAIQYVNSTALVWNPHWYWELPQWVRFTFFLLAIV